MYCYVSQTKLYSISGRAGYITNENAQEEIVLVSETVDFKPYAQYEKANQKSQDKNNQGREYMIPLPNEWYTELSRDELQERVKILVQAAVGKSTDLQWAVHWNRDRTNLHVHIVFSERTKIAEKDRKTWDRDIYLTADGKIARKKADRARDADGNIKPPIHKKGEKQGEFSVKDTKYKSKGYLHNVKMQVQELYKAWGIELNEPNLLPSFHAPKGSTKLQEINKSIAEINKNYKKLLENPKATQKDIDKFVAAAKNAAKTGDYTITKVLTGVPQRNLFERAIEGISNAAADHAARKAAEQAQRAATEQAQKAAAEAARQAAAEQAAAAEARKRDILQLLEAPISDFDDKDTYLDFVADVYKNNSGYSGDRKLQKQAFDKLIEVAGLSEKVYDHELDFWVLRNYRDVPFADIDKAVQTTKNSYKAKDTRQYKSLDQSIKDIKELQREKQRETPAVKTQQKKKDELEH